MIPVVAYIDTLKSWIPWEEPPGAVSMRLMIPPSPPGLLDAVEGCGPVPLNRRSKEGFTSPPLAESVAKDMRSPWAEVRLIVPPAPAAVREPDV